MLGDFSPSCLALKNISLIFKENFYFFMGYVTFVNLKYLSTKKKLKENIFLHEQEGLGFEPNFNIFIKNVIFKP